MRLCREKIRRPKAQQATAVKYNNKCLYKYVNNKRRAKKNLHPLLDVGGNIVTKEAEILNTFIASVFNSKTNCDLATQPPLLENSDREHYEVPIIQREMVNSLLHNLDTYKSMGPDRNHQSMLRDLAEMLIQPLSIIYQQSWLNGEVPANWRLANVTPIYKKGWKEDPVDFRPVSLTLVLGKVMKQIKCHQDLRDVKSILKVT